MAEISLICGYLPKESDELRMDLLVLRNFFRLACPNARM